jgi:hypothetical protein
LTAAFRWRAQTGRVSDARTAPRSAVNVATTLRLGAALGLVVIEFRNDSAAVTTPIPSERQIAAYQRWDVTHFGPAPMGRDETTAAAPASAEKS